MVINMNWVLLAVTVIGVSMQTVMQKLYNKKIGAREAFVFTGIQSAAAALFFLPFCRIFILPSHLFPYIIGFAAAFSAALIFSVKALACGSIALTSLAASYSLMLPTFYGLVFLNEASGILLYAGIALLAISIVFINLNKNDVKISPEWVLYVILALIGNGMCSTVQKMQQIAFEGKYTNEFMFFALVTVVAVAAASVLLQERGQALYFMKLGWKCAAIGGIMNGMANMLVMLLNGRINASVMFPCISAGSIALNCIIARVFWKEKLSNMQTIGVMLGMASVVLINI